MATQINRSMVSEVSICNQAMSWLGQPELTSLDDKTTAAQWCRNNYPFLRDAVIEEVDWTFATVRAMSEVADMDPWGLMYSHPIPIGWMSVQRVYKDVSIAKLNADLTWRKEESGILSENSIIYMWGVKRITDTGKFSPMFVQALAARLAADAAIPVTNSRNLQKDMWALYGDKIRAATARDGQQGANDKVKKGNLTTRRG